VNFHAPQPELHHVGGRGGSLQRSCLELLQVPRGPAGIRVHVAMRREMWGNRFGDLSAARYSALDVDEKRLKEELMMLMKWFLENEQI
jgi:hypothetical protein